MELPSTDPTELLTAADVGVVAILQMLTELRMSLGRDPDGSHTVGRFLQITGGYAVLGTAVSAQGQPWDARAAAAVKRLRERAQRAAPVLARLARRDSA